MFKSLTGEFHKRFNMARAAVYTADWEPDKAFKIQGNLVPYVSINKMKRNIAPALLKNGIDFDINFDELEMRMVGSANYWSVRCTVTFHDEYGNCMKASAIGGCAANDKGINICQTYALKQVLSNVFMLIDGIEPEDLEIKDASGTFRKKTEEEIEEVKSEILSNKEVVKAAPKEAVEETPKKEPATQSKVAPKIKSVDEDEVKAAPAPTAPADNGFELAGPQKNTVNKIVADWEEAAKNGTTTPENYNQMSYDYAVMSSVKDAVAFIRKYKVVF